MEKNLAPIALFVYNRPFQTKNTIDHLKKNLLSKKSELYIFSDGAKSKEILKKVKEVRRYIKTIKGFKKINIIERKENLGLAKSIIGGVTEILSKHEKIIVLEDDIQTSKHFLEFMNDSLDLYKDKKKVYGVAGYVYPTKNPLPETFFMKLTNCWGWGTWKRAWNIFEEDGGKLIKKINSKKDFDIDSSYPFFRMLKNQIRKKNDSWAIRWYASVFIRKGLFLYPKKSLVNNTGFDNEGTHCNSENLFLTEISKEPIKISKIKLTESKFARREFRGFFRGIFPKRLLNKIKKIFNLV